MIPRRPAECFDDQPLLGMLVSGLFSRHEAHVAEAVLGAVEALAEVSGPLWRDPRLYQAALMRALWVVGQEAEAEILSHGGVIPAACVESVWALCRAPRFQPLGILLACSGALGVESWPSSGGRPVVRLRLDPATLRDCAISELLTRETLRPLLESAAALLGPGKPGVVALVLPAGLSRPAPELADDARAILKTVCPQADLWWVN